MARGTFGMKLTMKADTSQPAIQACRREAHGSQEITGAVAVTEAAMRASAGRVWPGIEGRLTGNGSCLKSDGAPTWEVGDRSR